jgi:hypothetical protein
MFYIPAIKIQHQDQCWNIAVTAFSVSDLRNTVYWISTPLNMKLFRTSAYSGPWSRLIDFFCMKLWDRILSPVNSLKIVMIQFWGQITERLLAWPTQGRTRRSTCTWLLHIRHFHLFSCIMCSKCKIFISHYTCGRLLARCIDGS